MLPQGLCPGSRCAGWALLQGSAVGPPYSVPGAPSSRPGPWRRPRKSQVSRPSKALQEAAALPPSEARSGPALGSGLLESQAVLHFPGKDPNDVVALTTVTCGHSWGFRDSSKAPAPSEPGPSAIQTRPSCGWPSCGWPSCRWPSWWGPSRDRAVLGWLHGLAVREGDGGGLPAAQVGS